MGNLVEYQDWNDEEFKEDKKRAEKEKQGKYLRYGEDGKLRVRFLPPRVGEPRFLEVYEHFYKSDDDKWVKYVCPEKSGDRDCTDCARARKLFATGSEVDKKRAKDFVAKKKIYVNVIDRDDEIFGPKILELKASQKARLFKIRDIKGNFTDPGPRGYDITLTKSGKGFSTEYDAFDNDRSELGDEGWIARQADLREMTTVPTDEELEKMGVPLFEPDTDDEAEAEELYQ